MTAIECLTAVRQLLSDPTRWTQGVAAKDQNGNSVPPTCAEARCWCVLGAVYLMSWGDYHDNAKVLQCLNQVVFEHSARTGIGNGLAIGSYNDLPEVTHGEVMAILDEAIALAAAA